MAAPVAPATGDFITRAFWKAEVTDRWDAIYAPWTYYTPTWTASTTAPFLGNGTLVGAYMQIEKTVFLRLRLQLGSSSTPGSGSWSLGLPTGLVPVTFQTMHGFCASANGTVRWQMSAYLSASNGIDRMGIVNNLVGHATPFAWAPGDQLVLTGPFEIT